MTRPSGFVSICMIAALAAIASSSAIAQDKPDLSVIEHPIQVRMTGLESQEDLSSFTIQVGDARQELNIEQLGQEVLDQGFDYRSDNFLERFTEAFHPGDIKPEDQVDGLAALASSLGDGGMSALAAEEIVAFIQGAAECAALGGGLWPKGEDNNPRPRLVRSEMDLHFNIGPLPNGTHFGRGQFDVSSIKLLMCVVPSDPASSFPVFVDRRWVINVGDGALQGLQDQRFPPTDPDAPVYPYRLSAHGLGIELVSYYVSGVRQPYTDPLYQKSPHSCIDIFFNIVPTSDHPILVSKPDNLVFCAGGACGDKPPKLDATH